MSKRESKYLFCTTDAIRVVGHGKKNHSMIALRMKAYVREGDKHGSHDRSPQNFH